MDSWTDASEKETKLPKELSLVGFNCPKNYLICIGSTYKICFIEETDNSYFREYKEFEFGAIFRLSRWSFKCTKIGESHRICGSQQYYV